MKKKFNSTFNLSKTIIILFLNFIIIGCNYTVIKDPNALAKNQNKLEVIDTSATINWELIKTRVLSNCMDCHLNNKKPNLESLSLVQQHKNEILDSVLKNRMPKASDGYPPLSDCKKEILEVWINANAPDSTDIKVSTLARCSSNSGTDTTSPEEEIPLSQLPLNYQTLLTKILQPKCIKCHNPESEDLEAAGILFYPYKEILNRKHLWLKPGESSKIVKSVTPVIKNKDITLNPNDEEDSENEKLMPPPEKDTPLSPEQIKFMINWINSGLPEN